jgi:hypothetical protein
VEFTPGLAAGQRFSNQSLPLPVRQRFFSTPRKRWPSTVFSHLRNALNRMNSGLASGFVTGSAQFMRRTPVD